MFSALAFFNLVCHHGHGTWVPSSPKTKLDMVAFTMVVTYLLLVRSRLTMGFTPGAIHSCSPGTRGLG